MKRLTKLVPGLTLLALLFAITAAAEGFGTEGTSYESSRSVFPCTPASFLG